MLKELKTKYQNCSVTFIGVSNDGTEHEGLNVHTNSIEWDDDTHEVRINCILNNNTVNFVDLMAFIRNTTYGNTKLNIEAISSVDGESEKTILKNVYGIREITKTNCENCTTDHCRVYIAIWYDERKSKRL